MKCNKTVKEVVKFLTKPFGKQLNKGMTLIEIIIVVALLGTLMAYMVRSFVDTAEEAKVDQAKLAMGNIAQDLQRYRVHNGRFPTTEQGLAAMLTNPSGSKKWRGPYSEQKLLQDPWGVDFSYESDGQNFKIISAGKNSNMGDDDDISYPEAVEAATE